MRLTRRPKEVAGQPDIPVVSKSTPELEIPSRSLPVPDAEGWSLESIRAAWSTFSIDGSPEGALDPYYQESLGRVLQTWNLIRDERGLCLELGSNPFFLTWMLTNLTNLDVEQANYFGAAANNHVQELRWREASGIQHVEKMPMKLFNMESDEFPYEDETFDVVLFCEIIEHLLMDPLHALREIHRVLKPTGQLVLTTPNVGRLQNLIALVEGRSIYDPYSGFGPYGRHNREFTPHEINQILRFSGFAWDQIFTEDSCPWDRTAHASIESALARPLSGLRSNDLGQYIFAVARKDGSPRQGWPDAFYRSRPAGELVPLS